MSFGAKILSKSHVFERGDRLYLTTPLTIVRPTATEVEEYAFASAVRDKAPNTNIGWVQGRYVEAERGNLNNAMWLTDELALKQLTPMLMPVTVMHDPRTAVGTIADCKLISGDERARIDTVLAIWKHRFPEVWEETAENIDNGQMMQSMECYCPWYTCSECANTYVKLPGGAEQASWCDHLRSKKSRRILGEVCFTGTGLIFGSRGGRGAYTEAQLDHFQNEVAEYHERAHTDSGYRPSGGNRMSLIQIEESELSILRKERDDARTELAAAKETNRELSTKVETAEAAEKAAKEELASVTKAKTDLEEKAQRAEIGTKRLAALGTGFMAKLGEFSKGRLNELAGTASDEEWEAGLKEREELAGVKRDVVAEAGAAGGGAPAPAGGAGAPVAPAHTFADTEVASFMSSGVGAPAASGAPVPAGSSSIRTIAGALGKNRKPEPQPAAK